MRLPGLLRFIAYSLSALGKVLVPGGRTGKIVLVDPAGAGLVFGAERIARAGAR